MFNVHLDFGGENDPISTCAYFWSGDYKVGPLLVINGVITPISRVITPVTHL